MMKLMKQKKASTVLKSSYKLLEDDDGKDKEEKSIDEKCIDR